MFNPGIVVKFIVLEMLLHCPSLLISQREVITSPNVFGDIMVLAPPVDPDDVK